MRRAQLAFVITALLALTGAAASLASSHSGRSPVATAARLAPSKGGSFLSLWPACACGKRTTLDQFSLQNGRRLRQLARVGVAWPEFLNTPSVDRAGRVWMTFSDAAKCTNDTSTCGPVPNSCSGRVERLSLRSGRSTTVLSFPDSQSVTDAIPDPAATRLVLVQGGCITGFFNQHLVVRDLRSGRDWSIGADAAPCHELGIPSWSPNGRRLVFAYGPSKLSRSAHPPPNTCAEPRFNRLVIVSSGPRAAGSRNWNEIRAQNGCSYEVAAFDRLGVAAVEACVTGQQRDSSSVDLGPAFLVQLNPINRVVRRLRLVRGWEDGAMFSEPNGAVLISEGQPANAGYPARDWVWQFNGHALRVVTRYRTRDAPQIIAFPTAAP